MATDGAIRSSLLDSHYITSVPVHVESQREEVLNVKWCCYTENACEECTSTAASHCRFEIEESAALDSIGCRLLVLLCDLKCTPALVVNWQLVKAMQMCNNYAHCRGGLAIGILWRTFAEKLIINRLAN